MNGNKATYIYDFILID